MQAAPTAARQMCHESPAHEDQQEHLEAETREGALISALLDFHFTSEEL